MSIRRRAFASGTAPSGNHARSLSRALFLFIFFSLSLSLSLSLCFFFVDEDRDRARPLSTQGSSWGYFKSQFSTGLSTFDNNFSQNGSKNGAERGWDYPHEGPSVEGLGRSTETCSCPVELKPRVYSYCKGCPSPPKSTCALKVADTQVVDDEGWGAPRGCVQ